MLDAVLISAYPDKINEILGIDDEEEEFEDEFDPFDNDDEPPSKLSITEIDENLAMLRDNGFFYGDR